MGSTISSDERNSGKPVFSAPGAADPGTAAENIIRDTERVYGTLTGEDGLVYDDDGERRRIRKTVCMLVTDRRVVFAAGDEHEVDAGSLEYVDLASVDETDGVLVLTTTDGVRSEFPLPDDGETVGAICRHLEWVGRVRARVQACSNDVDLASGEIRDHTDAMEWRKAEMKYAEMRRSLDALVDAVHRTGPIPMSALAPELAEMERTLERAYACCLTERAESQLELGEQLVENHDFDRVGSVLADIERYYDKAWSHATAAERGDSFRFGEQRALYERLEQVNGRIEQLATAPIKRARELKDEAVATTDTALAADNLERALTLYERISDSPGRENLSGDIDAELQEVVDELVETRRQLTRQKWEAGTEHKDTGEIKRAIGLWSEAIEQLERAAQIATAHDHSDGDEIQAQARRLGQTLSALRDTAGPTRAPASTASTGDDSATQDPDQDSTESHDHEGTGDEQRDGGEQADGSEQDIPESGSNVPGRAENIRDLTEAILKSDPDEE